MSHMLGISSPPWSLRTRRTMVILLLVVLGIFAWRLAAIWPPIVVSLVLAYLLTPLVGLGQRLLPFGSPGLRRSLATALTFVLVVTVLSLLLLVLVPAIASQLRQFGEGLPALADQIERELGSVLDVPIAIAGQTIVPLDIIRSLAGNGTSVDFDFSQVDLLAFVRQFVGPLTVPVLGALGTALSGALSVIFVVTMMFYLMKDGPYFVEQIEGLFAERYQSDVRWLFQALGGVWNAYLRGQFLLSLTMGVVVFITASILGVRSPLVLGLISGLLEFIPNLGPALALAAGGGLRAVLPQRDDPRLAGRGLHAGGDRGLDRPAKPGGRLPGAAHHGRQPGPAPLRRDRGRDRRGEPGRGAGRDPGRAAGGVAARAGGLPDGQAVRPAHALAGRATAHARPGGGSRQIVRSGR